jgi:hypothetical protein
MMCQIEEQSIVGLHFLNNTSTTSSYSALPISVLVDQDYPPRIDHEGLFLFFFGARNLGLVNDRLAWSIKNSNMFWLYPVE